MIVKARGGLSDIFNLLLTTREENKIICLIMELTYFKIPQNTPHLQDWNDMQIYIKEMVKQFYIRIHQSIQAEINARSNTG